MGALSELKKALTTTGGGDGLLPYDLDPVLHEELLKLQPLADILGVVQAEGKTHEYRVRSSHPLAWFEGETTPANAQSGAYARKTVMLKIQRIWGEVTGFAQAVDEAFINALAEEIVGSLEGMANVFEYGILWGTADDIGFTGDAYQYSGMIPRVFAYAPTNVVDAGGDKITLADLDAGIAKVSRHRQTRNDPRMFMMGLEMKQVVDGLQTKVQLPLTTAQLADGRIVMDAYGRTPIFETDFLVPDTSTPSPTDLAAVEDDGNGALAADQYFYNISSVTVYGEQVAGTEANVTVTGGSDAIDLSWTADADAVLYFIWRGLATGNANLQLLDIIPAKTYDAAGTVNGTVATYKDDGSKTPIAIKPLSTGEENIVIANINPARGASFVGMVDDMGRQTGKLASFVELARVKDSWPYFLKSYLAAKVVYPNLVSVIRHCKRA